MNVDEEMVRERASLVFVMASPNNTRYKQRRKDTGISRPSLFSGLVANQMLGISTCRLDASSIPQSDRPYFEPLARYDRL
jgi:hypothetical protein